MVEHNGLKQGVSHMSRHQIHLEGLLGPIPSSLENLRWCLRICIYGKFPGDVDVAYLGPILGEPFV